MSLLLLETFLTRVLRKYSIHKLRSVCIPVHQWSVGKRLWLVCSVCLELKDFWRSQTVTQTVNVVIFQRWTVQYVIVTSDH